MVRSNDSKLFVELSGSHSFFESSQNANAILRVKEFLIGSWILSKALTGAARDGFIRLVDVDDVFRFRVKHPENLVSAIYHRRFSEIASYFGLQIADLSRDSASIGLPRTHLLDSVGDANIENVMLPVKFKPDFRFEKTNLLARVVEKWDEVPVGLLQHLDLRKSTYGYIGLEDFTLYPLIRPGSLVQIDAKQRKISPVKWKTEFERPIYFTELRDGYVCSWCEVDRGQLIVIPHPHSHQEVRRFDYPSQAEIIGRVTGVAMRIVGEGATEERDTSRDK